MSPMRQDTPFSYQCNGCGRCCYHKRIQVNPYEILRLARNLGISTGDFVRRHLERNGPYLRATDDGACIFLDGKQCSVHADRPLACRTYPLGRRVSATGEETFVELAPHPQTEGVYGQDGSIGAFLTRQGAYPYMEVADRYQALFYRMFDALQPAFESAPELAESVPSAMLSGDDTPAFMEWLDVDQIVGHYCDKQRLEIPENPASKAELHIAAIDIWLDGLTGGKHEQRT